MKGFSVLCALFIFVLTANASYSLVGSANRIGQTALVSLATNGELGNEKSSWSAISADGRYVAFQSDAGNLVDGDTNRATDVFVHDRQTSQTSRVSVATGGEQGNDTSYMPAISADGQYVAFVSTASNLVPGDTNKTNDIFVHNRQTGQTNLISVNSNGAQGNGKSTWPAISADGRFVAFVSQAENLVAGDSNRTTDVFVHDRQTSQTTRVSVASSGGQWKLGSGWPTISADGRYVAFLSGLSVQGGEDTKEKLGVFVHDRQTGESTRVAMAIDQEVDLRSPLLQMFAYGYGLPAISGDGRFVTFMSTVNLLVEGGINHYFDVFVHDRQTGQTNRISMASQGEPGMGNSFMPAISADGRYVAFVYDHRNSGTEGRYNPDDVYVYDCRTGQIVVVSEAVGGSENMERGGNSRKPVISADGRYIVFESEASNLVDGDDNRMTDVFIHDRGLLRDR